MNISVKDLFYNKIKLPSNQEDTNIILQPGEIIIGKDYIKIGLQTDNEEDILNRNNIVNIPISQNIIEKKEYTYKQLQELKENNELIPGERYILTDYYTQYYQPFGGINNVGEACSVLKVCDADYSEDLDLSQYYESICLIAISTNSFSLHGYSLKFVEDIIEYNFDDNTDEFGIFKPGSIKRRIDTTKHIDLPYDWRNIKFARYKYDLTETNGSIYAIKKEGLLDSGKVINIKINKGEPIKKDNLYIYINGDNKYFIYCINDCIFNGIDIDEISGLESTSENFVYFHDIYAFDCIQSPIYINENVRYCFNVESTKYEFYTFEGEGVYHNIKMDPAENLPNNIFFIDKNNELSNCYFGYNTENNTFINTYSTNITTKNNFKNNTCYNVINCSFENNCFNSILYNFENNICSEEISYSILINKNGYFMYFNMNDFMNIVAKVENTEITTNMTSQELKSLRYYGDKNILPSNESYFTVNSTGDTITGLTAVGKMQTELVIPYEINGITITTLNGNINNNSSTPISILDGANITKIMLPNSITELGKGAFYNCSSLLNITLPNSLTTIGDSAFAFCSSITNIEFPSHITQMGNKIFDSCTNLESITFLNQIKTISSYMFNQCVNLKNIRIPYGVTLINTSAFNNCQNLTFIEIPNSVEVIEAGAFENCLSLTSIDIPESIVSIEDGTFYNCTGLESIRIPKSVINIDSLAFEGITPVNLTVYCEQNSYAETYAQQKGFNIAYTDIDKNIIDNLALKKEIEGLQYYGDSSIAPSDESYFIVSETGDTITGLTDTGKTLTNVIVPYKINGQKITSIQLSDFRKTNIANKTIKTIVLPNSIININDYAFQSFEALAEINLPNSIEVLGGHCFRGCISLSNINIPNSVKTIKDGAFFRCAITSMIIPDSVIMIGSYVFSYCANLTFVKFSENTEHIGQNIFQDCSNLETVIMGGKVDLLMQIFVNCPKLTNIVLPDVKNISGIASKCMAIKSIKIPDGTTSLTNVLFYNCTSLEEITIPKSITEISTNAFNTITPSQLTVRCEQDSYAETYAQDKGFNIVYTDIKKNSLYSTISDAISEYDTEVMVLLGGD